MPGKLMPWHLNWLKDPEYDRVDLVKEGANSQAYIKLIKSRGGNLMGIEEILAAMKDDAAAIIRQELEKAKKEVPAEVQTKLDTITAEKATLEKSKKEVEDELTNLKVEHGIKDQSNPEEILKSVADPAIKALLKTQIAKAAAAETALKEIKEAKDKEEISKAVSECMALPVEEAKLTEVMKGLKKDPKLFMEVSAIFKSASEAISSGLLDEKGSNSSEGSNGSSEAAWNVIEKKADELVKKNICKTIEEATGIVMDQNPELYEQYMKCLN